MHALFESFAHRYDLHTPPDHDQHDHAYVIRRVRELGSTPRMLDVGCGTGVLIQKAVAAGIDARGIDAAEGMVRVARERLGAHRVERRRMQELAEVGSHDAVVCMSWTLNYADSVADLADVLRRMHTALRPGGLLIAQIAHAAHADGSWMEDIEPGPGGPDDVRLRYRFDARAGDQLEATYEYRCVSLAEGFSEAHLLGVADASKVAALARQVGFASVALLESWREEAFTASVCPFLIGWARR